MKDKQGNEIMTNTVMVSETSSMYKMKVIRVLHNVATCRYVITCFGDAFVEANDFRLT